MSQLLEQEAMLRKMLVYKFTGATGIGQQPEPVYLGVASMGKQQQAGAGAFLSEARAEEISAAQLAAQLAMTRG